MLPELQAAIPRIAANSIILIGTKLLNILIKRAPQARLRLYYIAAGIAKGSFLEPEFGVKFNYQCAEPTRRLRLREAVARAICILILISGATVKPAPWKIPLCGGTAPGNRRRVSPTRLMRSQLMS
jgi:hypothetical protein